MFNTSVSLGHNVAPLLDTRFDSGFDPKKKKEKNPENLKLAFQNIRKLFIASAWTSHESKDNT